jgi:hypothetical protein
VSGVRSEPAEVWLIDDRPARFVWRERLYTVLSILERPAARPPAARPAAAQPSGATDESDENQRIDQPQAPEPQAPAWRCWRVTAAAGRNVPPSTFRLCQDTATDRWLLTRAHR